MEHYNCVNVGLETYAVYSILLETRPANSSLPMLLLIGRPGRMPGVNIHVFLNLPAPIESKEIIDFGLCELESNIVFIANT